MSLIIFKKKRIVQILEGLFGSELNYDPFWDQTVLSVHGAKDDIVGDLSINYLKDTSVNAYAVTTRNSNVVPSLENPFNLNTCSSINLSTTGTGFDFPKEAGTIDTGPFCIELWIRPTTTGVGILNTWYWQTGNNAGIQFYITANGKLALTASQGVWNAQPAIYTSANSVTLNVWSHIALVRDENNNLTTYINGVRDATIVSYAESLDRTSNGTKSPSLRIGYLIADGKYFQGVCGFISNLRIVTGSPVYTDNFTPSAQPLTNLPGTKLLLTGSHDGVNAPFNNHTFIDSSSNNLSITRAGNVSQGSFSPFGGQGGSAYFSGNDYFNLPTQVSSVLTTQNFTLECWVNFNNGAATTYHHIFCSLTNTDWTTNCLWFGKHISHGGKITFWSHNFSASTPLLVDPVLPPSGVWTHYAVVRNGNVFNLYRNGVSVAQANYTGAISGNVGNAYIGSTNGTIQGYLSNFRISSGIARYTGNFNVPTAPFEPDQYDTVLLKFENAGIVDETNTAVLETIGNVVPTTTDKKYGNTAIYFPGGTNYMTASAASSISGIGDFTVELWIKPIPFASGYRILFANRTSGGFSQGVNATGTIFFGRSLTSIDGTTTNAVVFGQWNHIAVCRHAGVLRVFINGIQGYSSVNTTGYNSGVMTIGIDGDNTSYPYSGYIDDIRISKYARYQTNFIPRPTLQNPDVAPTEFDPYWDKVVLRMTMDGDDNGSSFIDLTGNSVSAFGGASLNAVSKFGSTSARFNTGKYLSVNASTYWDLFSDNAFTIECWINLESLSAGATIASRTSWSSASRWNGWTLLLTDNCTKVGFITWSGNDTTSNSGMPSYNFNTNTWYHIAATKVGAFLHIFVDGKLIGTQTYGAFTTPLGVLSISRISVEAVPEHNLVGYIDDVRITKGIARYTKNFEVPSKSLPVNDYSGSDHDPYWNQTVLAMSMDNFSDAKGKTVSKVGNVSISATQSKFGTGSAYFPVDGYLTNIISASSEDFNFGTSDLTIELWYKPEAKGNMYPAVVANYNHYGTGAGIIGIYDRHIMNNGKFTVALNTGASAAITSVTTPINGTWYHLALTRSGNDWKFFVNGVLEGTTTVSFTARADSVLNIGNTLDYASTSAQVGLNGWIDDVRVTKGKARYTQNFVPPTQPHPTINISI